MESVKCSLKIVAATADKPVGALEISTGRFAQISFG